MSEEHTHENEEHTHAEEEDKDGVIEFLTRQLDHYKVELSHAQAQEQMVSRELISYLIMERNAIRQALERQE